MTKIKLIALKESMIKSGNKISPNSKIFKEYKATLNGLTEMQYQAAVGLILGDARIEINKKNNSALLKFEWGNKNKEYAFHVYNLFTNYCITPPREQVRININGNKNITWCFQTLTHPDFVPLAKLFLINNKKVVPTNLITNHLTPLGLAYWFIDDGGILGSHSYGIQFHTQGFTIAEVDNICNELSNKFNLITWRYIHKNKPIINISAKSYSTFLSLINDKIVDCMRTKLRKRL